MAFLMLMLRRTASIFMNCIEDMKVPFQDVYQLEIPDWVIHPFINISGQGILAEELIILQNDFELKPKFSVSYINHFDYKAE